MKFLSRPPASTREKPRSRLLFNPYAVEPATGKEKKRLENSFADDLKIVQRNIRAKNHNRLPIYLPVILIISSYFKMNGLKDHKIIICQLMVRSSGKKFAKLNKFVLPINLYSKVNFKILQSISLIFLQYDLSNPK